MNGQTLHTLKLEMVECCQRLWQRGLVANHDGNVTYRLSNKLFLATPTSFSKKDVTVDDLIVVDDQGVVVEGSRKVFSEIFMHLAIYRVRADISCVVHGHPPVASGFGLARREIGVPAIPEAIVSLGRSILNLDFYSPLDPVIKSFACGSLVASARCRRPSLTPDFDRSSDSASALLTDSAIKLEADFSRVLGESDAFISPGNGAWTVGCQLNQTYLRLELVEHVAKQHLSAQQLGGVVPLPAELVDQLMAKRPVAKTSVAKPLLAKLSVPNHFGAEVPASTRSSDLPRDFNSGLTPDLNPDLNSDLKAQIKKAVLAELSSALK